jgi:hypothetical protein
MATYTEQAAAAKLNDYAKWRWGGKTLDQPAFDFIKSQAKYSGGEINDDTMNAALNAVDSWAHTNKWTGDPYNTGDPTGSDAGYGPPVTPGVTNTRNTAPIPSSTAPYVPENAPALNLQRAPEVPAFSYRAFVAPTEDDVMKDPGVKFRISQATKALMANKAAQGLARTGATRKAFDAYTQELAGQEYGKAYDRAMNEWLQGYTTEAGKYMTNYGVTRDKFASDREAELAEYDPRMQTWTARTNAGQRAYEIGAERDWRDTVYNREDAYRRWRDTVGDTRDTRNFDEDRRRFIVNAGRF